MTSSDFLSAEIKKRYGTVKRARGCFLYTSKNSRLVDLYQEGGRAILGWGGNPFTVLKNVLSRGLTGSFPTDYDYRLRNAVSSLLNSPRAIFIFSDKMQALRAAVSFSKDGTTFWKPWLKLSDSVASAGGDSAVTENDSFQMNDCVVIEPPLPWTQNVFLLAVNAEVLETHMAHGFPLPQVITLPSPLSAAISRAIYNMIAELPKRSEKDWFIYDKIICKYWTRKGPYLFPKIDAAKYGEFICHCLDCGIVISPEYNVPSIVPFGADIGVFSKLKNNPFSAD